MVDSCPYRPVHFLPTHMLPAGFAYPESYKAFAATNRTDVGPVNEDWRCPDTTEVVDLVARAQQYRGHQLVPFMRRNGDDGVACFDAAPGNAEPRVYEFYSCQGVRLHEAGATFAEWLASIPPGDPEDTD